MLLYSILGHLVARLAVHERDIALYNSLNLQRRWILLVEMEDFVGLLGGKENGLKHNSEGFG